MIQMTEKSNHLLIEIKGLIDFEKITAFISDLMANERYLTMHNIWHFEQTTVGIKYSEFMELVKFISNSHPNLEEDSSKIAIVTSTAMEYALATIWVGYSQILPFDSANFSSLSEAEEWLG